MINIPIQLILLENVMAGGRPTKYKPEYCDLAEVILANDEPMCAVAAALGVHRGTLRDWKKKYSEFSTAVSRGRTQGKALFMKKVDAAAWDADTYKVNNRLIWLLAMNQYQMLISKSKGKSQVDMSLADAVRKRHEASG
jgi:hypothetical protein